MESVDLSMLAKLDEVVEEATIAFESFDYARALERTEAFFWWFCDNYVELVKGRTYNEDKPEAADSAKRALRTALATVQRLFAPTLPFVTEEAWEWWHDTSIHLSPWPTPTNLGGDATLIDPTIEVLVQVRRAKTEAKQSQRAKVASLTISTPDELLESLREGQSDLIDAGSILALEVGAGTELSTNVTLAPTD
jgi:valyl-tRNA synthetase